MMIHIFIFKESQKGKKIYLQNTTKTQDRLNSKGSLILPFERRLIRKKRTIDERRQFQNTPVKGIKERTCQLTLA